MAKDVSAVNKSPSWNCWIPLEILSFLPGPVFGI
jgi:hypothetical protein